jgi:hypothetical protein
LFPRHKLLKKKKLLPNPLSKKEIGDTAKEKSDIFYKPEKHSIDEKFF